MASVFLLNPEMEEVNDKDLELEEVNDKDLPSHVKYWLTATSQNDCFFVLGPESDKTERIGAIKIFLCGHSEPLRNMLINSEMAEQGDVRVEDIEPRTFRTFLSCVYGGTDTVLPKLSFEMCVNLLYVLEKYLVTEIKPKVVSCILQTLPLTLDNVLCALSNPVCSQDEGLEKAILEIVAVNGEKIITSNMLLQLSQQGLLATVKAECLNTSETNVWDAVVKWAKHTTGSNDGKVLRKQILSHLRFVRFCTFDSEDFCKKVVPTGILTDKEVVDICNYFGTGKALESKDICNSTDPRPTTKVVAEITFHHIVDVLELLSLKIQISKNFFFNNCYWHLELKKEETSLSSYLYCNRKSENTTWTIPVVVQMVLLNQKGQPNCSASFTHTFSSDIKCKSWGFKTFCDWNKLMNNANGFVNNNTAIVSLTIK